MAEITLNDNLTKTGNEMLLFMGTCKMRSAELQMLEIDDV